MKDMRKIEKYFWKISSFHYFMFPILFAVLLFSCKKDNPAISEVPEIEFVSVSPATVTEYQDQLTITISYTDGDGNLGENNPDVTNLFLTDMRNGVTYEYRVKQLAPHDATISIKGQLEVVLNSVAILSSSNQESVNYSIYVKDRAGNTSNTVTTSTVTVMK